MYGGKGALGSTLVNHFKSKDWWVCSIDLRENPEADVNVVVKGATLEEQAAHVGNLYYNLKHSIFLFSLRFTFCFLS